MIIEVLGLGESVKEYVKTSFTSIGVNDIYKYHKTDYIVMVDPPTRFYEEDRKKTILESTPKKFYCNHVWDVPNFELIKLASPRGCLKKLDSKDFCYSNNSAFVATVLAYKMGATRIVLHGVDFKNHIQLSTPHNFDMALKHFNDLYLELKKRGVNLCVYSAHSSLSKILPCLSD